MGRLQSEKEDFWVVLSRTMAAIRPDEKLIVYGDMNCHVGEKAEGLVEVHGGQWYELRGWNAVEFAESMEIAVVNTWFTKDVGKRVTYELGGNKSQIDFLLVWRPKLTSVTDIEVIGEECTRQHKLLLCIMELRDHARSHKQKPVSRYRVWKLKNEVVRKRYAAEVQQLLAAEKGTGVEVI
jgi:hypothetical protein